VTASILDEVRQVLADILNVPIERIDKDSSPETLPDWDSLQHLNLVLALEQNSGLEFSPEEIEQMLSVNAIAILIQEKLSRKKVEQQEG
jgi:acyl carrier protein